MFLKANTKNIKQYTGGGALDAGKLKNSSYQLLENSNFLAVRGANARLLENLFFANKNFSWNFTFELHFLIISGMQISYFKEGGYLIIARLSISYKICWKHLGIHDSH